MPPAAGWCWGTLRGLTLLGSVIELDVTHDGTAGSSGGAFLAGLMAIWGRCGRFYRPNCGAPDLASDLAIASSAGVILFRPARKFSPLLPSERSFPPWICLCKRRRLRAARSEERRV